MSDNLSDVFDIAPLPRQGLPIVQPEAGKKDVADDAAEVRRNLKQLVNTAQDALEYALDMAKQSESPRAYEVLANLLNTAADLNTKLIDVHTAEQKITKPSKEEPAGTQHITNNNVVFTGTTSELGELIMQRMIKK
jgi:hypothetical protein